MTYWVFFVASAGVYEMGTYQNKNSCEAARTAVIEMEHINTEISKCIKLDIYERKR